MSEIYRGVELNLPNDAPEWGQIENKAFHDIIDLILDTDPSVLHNNLEGIQGGSANARYHLTLEELEQLQATVAQVQSDWNVTDDQLPSFIRNKPTMANTLTEVLASGNDAEGQNINNLNGIYSDSLVIQSDDNINMTSTTGNVNINSVSGEVRTNLLDGSEGDSAVVNKKYLDDTAEAIIGAELKIAEFGGTFSTVEKTFNFSIITPSSNTNLLDADPTPTNTVYFKKQIRYKFTTFISVNTTGGGDKTLTLRIRNKSDDSLLYSRDVAIEGGSGNAQAITLDSIFFDMPVASLDVYFTAQCTDNQVELIELNTVISCGGSGGGGDTITTDDVVNNSEVEGASTTDALNELASAGWKTVYDGVPTGDGQVFLEGDGIGVFGDFSLDMKVKWFNPTSGDLIQYAHFNALSGGLDSLTTPIITITNLGQVALDEYAPFDGFVDFFKETTQSIAQIGSYLHSADGSGTSRVVVEVANVVGLNVVNKELIPSEVTHILETYGHNQNQQSHNSVVSGMTTSNNVGEILADNKALVSVEAMQSRTLLVEGTDYTLKAGWSGVGGDYGLKVYVTADGYCEGTGIVSGGTYGASFLSGLPQALERTDNLSFADATTFVNFDININQTSLNATIISGAGNTNLRCNFRYKIA